MRHGVYIPREPEPVWGIDHVGESFARGTFLILFAIGLRLVGFATLV